MKKETARKLLEYYLKKETELPKFEVKVTEKKVGNIIETWTFRGLLKIAYDLEDKK